MWSVTERTISLSLKGEYKSSHTQRTYRKCRVYVFREIFTSLTAISIALALSSFSSSPLSCSTLIELIDTI